MKRSEEHTAGVPKVRIAAALAELCGSWQSCGTRTGCLLAAPCGVTGQGQQVLPVGIEMYQLSFPALCWFVFLLYSIFWRRDVILWEGAAASAPFLSKI